MPCMDRALQAASHRESSAGILGNRAPYGSVLLAHYACIHSYYLHTMGQKPLLYLALADSEQA